jgi:hypothetical protein
MRSKGILVARLTVSYTRKKSVSTQEDKKNIIISIFKNSVTDPDPLDP